MALEHERWRSRADYLSGRTAGLTTQGVSRVVRQALKSLRRRKE